MKIRILLAIALVAVPFGFLRGTSHAAGGGGVVTADPTKHFDPKGKMPSKFTIELQNGLRKSLPFEA